MIALLIALGNFGFDGGSSKDFVAALSSVTQETVVCFSAEPIGKVSLTFSSQSELPGLLTERLRLHSSDPKDFLFWSDIYPLHLVVSNTGTGAVPELAKADIACSGGRAYGKSRTGSLMDVGSLDGINSSKPIRVHWLYQRLQVAVRPAGERESVFLKMVADAIGADFYDTPKEYRLEFSPSQYRTRARATYRALGLADAPPVDKDDAAFADAVLAIASDKELETAFAAPGRTVQIAVPTGSTLPALARARLEREFGGSTKLSGSQQEAADWITKNVILDSLPFVLLEATRKPLARFQCRDRANHWFDF